MNIGAAGGHLIAQINKTLAQCLGILNDLRLVALEFRRFGLLEGRGNASNGIVVRATLQSWEDRLIDAVFQIVHHLVAVGLGAAHALAEEDDASAWAAQRLVRRCGHNVGKLEWRRYLLGGNQASHMRHIGHQIGADFVADLTESSVIEQPGIARDASNDDLRPERARRLCQLVVVDQTRLRIYLVRHALKEDGCGRDFLAGREEAVRQMAAIGQIQAHNTIVWTQYARVDSQVGRRPRIRLHIDAPLSVAEIEKFKSTCLRQALNLINKLITAIIAVNGEREREERKSEIGEMTFS